MYLVVLEDRHFDDRYLLYNSFKRAMSTAQILQCDYDDYEWEEEKIDGWEYYAHADIEDGPTVRIQKIDVED